LIIFSIFFLLTLSLGLGPTFVSACSFLISKFTLVTSLCHTGSYEDIRSGHSWL
jgi:hypothetical protein